MNLGLPRQPLTPSLSPSDGERAAAGRVRAWFMIPMSDQAAWRFSMIGWCRLRAVLAGVPSAGLAVNDPAQAVELELAACEQHLLQLLPAPLHPRFGARE
jgi:hypothetical protein